MIRSSESSTGPAWHIDAGGWLSGATHLASPNCDVRPHDTVVCLVVVHAISLPPGTFTGDAVAEFFTNRLNPAAHEYFSRIAHERVSAHFFVRRDGAVIQFVSCEARAWHAGTSCWRGRQRCNDFSIGIELEGDDCCDYEGPQYATLAKLLDALQRRYPLDAVVGHADIAPGRKTDPGPHFDWSHIPDVRRR
jgi:AmpD protein